MPFFATFALRLISPRPGAGATGRSAIRLEETRPRTRHTLSADAPTQPRDTLHLHEVWPLERTARITSARRGIAHVGRRRVLDLELDAQRISTADVHHHATRRHADHTPVDAHGARILVGDPLWAEDRAEA